MSKKIKDTKITYQDLKGNEKECFDFFAHKQKMETKESKLKLLCSKEFNITLKTVQRYVQRWRENGLIEQGDDEWLESIAKVVKQADVVLDAPIDHLKLEKKRMEIPSIKKLKKDQLGLDNDVLDLVVNLTILGYNFMDILSYINSDKNFDKPFYKKIEKIDDLYPYLYGAKNHITESMIIDISFSNAITLQRLEMIFKRSMTSQKYETAMRCVVTQATFREKVYQEMKKHSKDFGTMDISEIDEQIRLHQEELNKLIH